MKPPLRSVRSISSRAAFTCLIRAFAASFLTNGPSHAGTGFASGDVAATTGADAVSCGLGGGLSSKRSSRVASLKSSAACAEDTGAEDAGRGAGTEESNAGAAAGASGL